MKKHLLTVVFCCLIVPLIAQQNFRLLMEAGRSELTGDGDDYTTLIITARDADGEIMLNVTGDVAVRTNAGLLDEYNLKMQNGVAMVKYTAPIVGQPVKASQRMMLFLVKFMQKFISRSAGSTNLEANQKTATDVAIETIKEGLNPFVLTVKDEKDAYVYFVCEMNGVKAKTKIQILKATEGGNASILPGSYHGYDITGQAEFNMDIRNGGYGQMNQGGTEANTILFTNEQATEFNNAMVKMLGGGGFMNAYLGPGASELKYTPGFDIKKQGMGSFYLPMPDNGIFLYMPPVLFDYAGRIKATPSSASEPQEPEETAGITCEPVPVIGDGRSRVKVKFLFKDDKGIPVGGKSLRWTFPKEFKVISQETVTNAAGIANAELQAPVIKGGQWKISDITNAKFISDNTSIFTIRVYYDSPKKQNQYTESQLTVYKTIDAVVHIVKPGFEEGPFKILLPNAEAFKLQGNLFTLLKSSGITADITKLSVNDAVVAIEGPKFENEFFRSAVQNRTLSREDFITRLKNCGIIFAFTGKDGNFTLSTNPDVTRKFTLEPIEAKISDLTGRRSGALIEALGMLSGGADTQANPAQADGTVSGQMAGALDYKQKVLGQIHDMEAMLCSNSYGNAMGVEEKLHLIGMLMTNTKSTSRLMEDTGKEFIGHAWNLFYMLIEVVNEKCKVTESLYKYAGSTRPGTFAGDQWSKLDLKIAGAITGEDRKTGVKRLIRTKLTTLLTNTPAAEKATASAGYYRVMGNLKETAKGDCINKLTEAFSEAFSKINPLPDDIVGVVKGYFYADLRSEVDKLISQNPEKVHAIYSRLQPHLRDYSTDLRGSYSSIAATRFNTEMYKADWDLFRDVVVKGGLLVYDIQTGNWLKIKSHLETLDKFNKLTDAAYEGTGLLLEIWRYSYLWSEAKAGFTVANKSIEQGVITTADLYEEKSSNVNRFSIFSSAMAASGSASVPVAAAVNLAGVNFSITSGQVPVESINKAMQGLVSYNQWIEMNIQNNGRLIGYKPAIAGTVYSAGNAFDEQLTVLLASALAYSANNSDESMQAFQQAAAKLQKTALILSGSLIKAEEEIKALPENAKIDLQEAPGNNEMVLLQNPLYIKAAAGVLILILIIFSSILILRRRRKKKVGINPTTEPVNRQAFNSQIITPPPAVQSPVQEVHSEFRNPQSGITSLKFCPQCGSPLSPGKKFCGKCGFKIPS